MLQAAVAAVYGLATLSGGCIGYVAWQTRDQPGGLPLFGIVVGACWWCGMLFLANQVEAFGVSAWLQRSTYLGVAVIVACVVLFAAEYTGRDDVLTARNVALPSIHPAAVAVFVVLNPGGAFFTSVDPAPTVTVEPTDGGFSVADDGTGIPASDHDRVFESGYSTGKEGVGTGLAVVRQLASAHDWTVSATNGADGGARFEFDGVDPVGPPDEL